MTIAVETKFLLLSYVRQTGDVKCFYYAPVERFEHNRKHIRTGDSLCLHVCILTYMTHSCTNKIKELLLVGSMKTFAFVCAIIGIHANEQEAKP